MRKIRIEKITLNMGVGQAGDELDKANKLMEIISKAKPVLTKTMKRNPTWGLRPNLTIGTKVTLRGEKARELLSRLLNAKGNTINPKSFDENGNVSFGIHEYIDIPKVEYDPKIGIRGLEVSITLERSGYRIKRRKIFRKKIPKKHEISKEEAQEFMKKEFNIVLEEEEK